MADPSGVSILRGKGCETIHQGAQQNESADRKSRDGNNRRIAPLRCKHPIGDLIGSTVWSSDQEVADLIMLVITDHQHSLSGERMKRIPENSFERQKPGIMAPARMAARVTGLR